MSKITLLFFAVAIVTFGSTTASFAADNSTTNSESGDLFEESDDGLDQDSDEDSNGETNDDSNNARLIRIRLVGNERVSGKAFIFNEPSGTDLFVLKMRGLKPKSRYSVFLTESATPGALPAQFLGDFVSNKKGKGRFRALTEIVNAFASANESLEDLDGIANVPGAGGIVGGANTIPLNWIRVYLVPPTGGNVFGSSETKLGGPLVLTSEEALP